MDYKRWYSEFVRNGCLKIDDFLNEEEVGELKQGLSEVLDKMPDEHSHTFSVYGSGKNRDADDFFMNSGDKIRYFFENDAFDSESKLLLDKREALNKVGYAIHWWNPLFKKHTFSKKIKDLLRNFEYRDPVVVQSMLIFKDLLRNFEYRDPVVVQSMLIFKKPKIGEIVKPHQDSTFLYTEPPSCIGLWFPLEDATLQNGCLWYVPGSHKGEVCQRFVRNTEKDPMFVLQGSLPDYSGDQYIPVPAKKGDCVVIHGSVVHKSGRNSTAHPRTVYTYHLVEREARWSQQNWIQPTETLPFPSLYHN